LEEFSGIEIFNRFARHGSWSEARILRMAEAPLDELFLTFGSADFEWVSSPDFLELKPGMSLSFL
jgi:hypothetical protein